MPELSRYTAIPMWWNALLRMFRRWPSSGWPDRSGWPARAGAAGRHGGAEHGTLGRQGLRVMLSARIGEADVDPAPVQVTQ